MIRNSTKLTAIAAVALLGGATALNCSKASSPSAIGDVKLAFALPDGLTIKQVSYRSTRPATPRCYKARSTRATRTPLSRWTSRCRQATATRFH